MKRPRFLSELDTIRSRLLRLVLLVLVPGLLVAATVTWRSLQADRVALQGDLHDDAFIIGLLIDSRAARTEASLRLLARSEAARQLDLASLRQLAQAASPQAGRILVTGLPGQPVLDTGTGAVPVIPKIMVDSPRAATSWTLDAHGAPALLLTVPFLSSTQAAGPVEITACIPMMELQQAIDQVRLPEGWSAGIFTSDQRVVVRSPQPTRFLMHEASPDIAAALRSGRFMEGSGHNRVGQSIRFAASVSAQYGIHLAVVAPVDFIAQPSRQSLLLLIFCGAGLVVLGLLVARSVARSITKPIEALALATRQLGELGTLPEVPGGLAEANQVAQAMQAAHVTLLERRNALSELNATLAARVAARTAELAAANTALEEQRTQLGLILDHMPIGVLVTDVDGNEIYANHEARALIGEGAGGFTDDAAPGMLRGGVAVPFDDVPSVRARRGIVTVRELLSIVRPDGARLELEVSAGPVLDRHGYIALTVTTLAEVSARLEAEETRRRSQRLEAVGQLTGGVAHEFNNLLMAIGGCIELLRPMVGGERARTLLENAGRATDHGARLTQQLLAFARRQNLQPEVVDLNALVSSMQELLSSTLGRGIEITAELEQGAWPALADATQLELVLLNLAINARDAMPQGGRLIIGTGNATRGAPGRPEEPPPGDYAMVSVRDTGHGMKQDVMGRIFEPFFTTKDVGRGTGLGLPQVLGVVQQLGGGVSVVSAPDQGTTISVFLPRALSPLLHNPAPVVGLAPAAPAPAAPPLRGLTILLVDDDAEVRHVTRAIMEDMGALVCEATSGGAALLLLGTIPEIDLVLADYTMPEMTGLELANHISIRWPELPVVLMTGYSAAALEGGFAHISAVLQKPFRAEKLITALRQALASDAAPAASIREPYPYE